jgi:type I restriction enzyme M protein
VHTRKIIDTYQHRTEAPRCSRTVEMAEIEKNDFDLNVSRYISTAVGEEEIILVANHAKLIQIEKDVEKAKAEHNKFLKELGLPLLP